MSSFSASVLPIVPRLILVCAGLLHSGPALTAQQKLPGWELVWSDEFNGDAIDRSKWDFDLGNGFYNYGAHQWIHGWGNDELQWYTDEPANAFVKGGTLRIRALKESRHGCGYTSARMKTRKRGGSSLFHKKYGRFVFRAKFPTGQGIWPALWLLPQKDTYGGWASSGEIDVLEVKGQEPRTVVGTIHYGSGWPNNTEGSTVHTLPDGGRIDAFHTYAVEWEPDEIRWFVDGKRYGTQRFWWSCSKRGADNSGANPVSEADLNPWPAPFNQPFYLVMNLAIGGKFVGNPDETTPFPAEMQVDWVRVYDKVGGYDEPRPRGPGKLPFKSR